MKRESLSVTRVGVSGSRGSFGPKEQRYVLRSINIIVTPARRERVPHIGEKKSGTSSISPKQQQILNRPEITPLFERNNIIPHEIISLLGKHLAVEKKLQEAGIEPDKAKNEIISKAIKAVNEQERKQLVTGKEFPLNFAVRNHLRELQSKSPENLQRILDIARTILLSQKLLQEQGLQPHEIELRIFHRLNALFTDSSTPFSEIRNIVLQLLQENRELFNSFFPEPAGLKTQVQLNNSQTSHEAVQPQAKQSHKNGDTAQPQNWQEAAAEDIFVLNRAMDEKRNIALLSAFESIYRKTTGNKDKFSEIRRKIKGQEVVDEVKKETHFLLTSLATLMKTSGSLGEIFKKIAQKTYDKLSFQENIKQVLIENPAVELKGLGPKASEKAIAVETGQPLELVRAHIHKAEPYKHIHQQMNSKKEGIMPVVQILIAIGGNLRRNSGQPEMPIINRQDSKVTLQKAFAPAVISVPKTFNPQNQAVRRVRAA